MAQIVPKLNLNKTPSTVESNSLVFAKNIRLDIDGSIHRDYGVFPMSIHKGKVTNKLVNYKNILNRIISDVAEYINTDNPEDYIVHSYSRLNWISGKEIKDENNNVIAKKGTHKIVGIIPNSNEFYIFINGNCVIGTDPVGKDIVETYNFIIRYDEKEDKFYPCNCNWNWSGGTITGCVINNLLGEKILNIGEKDATTIVPLKCINLNTSNITDDERIYTQTPNIPITNLNYIDSFNYVIPNGVYQFFVRYKIRDNFYTDWFPASKELFAGNRNTSNTSFGTVKFVNTHRDSDNSFKFSVEHLFIDQKYNYESFQIGFIVSHDDAIMARAWKHFDFNVNIINFDYNARDAYEIEVIDLLKSAYQIYDVGNITSFKNKLYIANYKETDFNENYQNLANQIGIEITDQSATSGYGDNGIIERTLNGKKVIAGLKIGEEEYLFSGANGIIDQLLRLNNSSNDESVIAAITDAIGSNKNGYTKCGAKKWDITLSGDKQSLTSAQVEFRNKFKGNNYTNFKYETDIQLIKVDGSYVTVESDKTLLLNNIIAAIYGKTRYMNENCVFINNNGAEDYQIDIEIIRNCSYTYKHWVSNGMQPNDPSLGIGDINQNPGTDSGTIIGRPDNTIPGGSNTGGYYEYSTANSSYTQTISIIFSGDRSKYKSTNSNLLLGYTTLIPYQKYKFYIHYVKQNGEITNGYYCNGLTGGIKTVPYKSAVDSVIFPKFTNINLPEGYVACFFSIVHVENTVATVFDIDTNNTYGEASCMDINIGLIAGSDNMTIKQGYTESQGGNEPTNPDFPINPDFPLIPTNLVDSESVQPQADTETTVTEIKTNTAKYYYSSDTSNIRYFGADGVIQFDKDSNIKSGKVAYLINDYTISDAEDTQLTKCTPFINPLTLSKINDTENVYSSFDDMNLLGFICAINPLHRERTIKYYTDGSSVYIKKNVENVEDGSGTYFSLVELKNHLLDTSEYDEKLTALHIINTDIEYIYSNYNLNYIGLNEDPIETYKTYYNNSSEQTIDKSTPTGSVVLRLFKSLMMSSTYMLPAMYKNYTKKTYNIYRRNEVTEFNNTIRASKLEGDESSINIYKFEPNDYYNVPTNRGLIVNIISVGDAILVHTEDSMFRFSGSNKLQSSDGEIQPAENNVFDTGVSEIFGSDFGFAGLQYKTDHIVTENGYIFFDRDSRIVYMYSGQGQIVKLSDSIEKLFRHRSIESIRFANDYYNNRFFMSILFYENYNDTKNGKPVIKQRYYPVTLSFNVTENIKSFVSLHDFYYGYAFNTKTKCYFLVSDMQDICTIDKKHKGCYTKLELPNDKLYLQRKEISNIILANSDTLTGPITVYNINSYDSLIDIINNVNYEEVKTLNAINWCGNKVKSEFRNVDTSDDVTLNMVEEVNTTVPCKYIRIYSDTCMSDLLPCTARSNDKSISSIAYTKYPFYNQGTWSFNYFRNILNSKNHKNPLSGDNNSLIEGKYFVVRFVFDSDFKLETLYLNYNIK